MEVIASRSWFTLTDTGIVFDGDFTKEQWDELGSELAKSSKSLMWMIGDWLLAGADPKRQYLPEGKLDEACKRFGIEYQTAKDAKVTCNAFPQRFRRPNLSYGHHQTIAGREDKVELLDWAVETNATVRQLRAEKKRRQMNEEVGVDFAEGRKGDLRWQFLQGDCLCLDYEDDEFDLVFCSPPYESQRSYAEVEFSLEGEDWVEWAADCFMECLRVSKGLVAWVCEGRQEDYSYSYTPFLLGAELQRRGAKLRKPIVYQRQGIPGSGGPDWLRNDWEPVICATKNGKLPWFDISETGTKPVQNKPRAATNRHKDGSRKELVYVDPEFSNPGNVVSGRVGAGQMGWKDATQNEAPFPEWLAEFFIKTFCPAGGCVLDPFSGSGTTIAMAIKNGRSGVGIDRRESQVWLGETRLMGLSVNERKSGQGLLV